MVKVFKGTKDEYYMDGYLQENLDLAKKVITKDWDMLFVYDGYEGSGKSVKAQQDAFYCDKTLNMNRIVFNPEDFKKAVDNATKYTAVVYDEAYGGLSSKGAMGNVNKSIVQKLTEIRRKNLFIFIVLPTFFDLDKYVALWRSRALIHVYSEAGFARGYFKFYNTDRKKQLYVNGKKFYNYSEKMVRPNFRGRFTNHYTVDEKAYRKKKDETSLDIEDNFKVGLVNRISELKRTIVGNINTKPIGLTRDQKAAVLDVTRQTIQNYLKKYDIEKEYSDI